MIDKNGFATQAEFELRNTRSISQSTRHAWRNLPDGARMAFDRAMVFLDSSPSASAEAPPQKTSEADRIAAARLMLMKLSLDTADPRWSSEVLDRLLKAVMETPEGSVSDLIRALFGVLGDYTPELTNPVASLIKELVVRCFTRQQRSYGSVDWTGIVQTLGVNATKPQLYLALHAIPPQFVPAQLANAITKGLESTAYYGEAVSALAV